MDVGIDITSIERFKDKKTRFIEYILTNEERADFSCCVDANKARFLATHWACKEAIFKATQDKDYLKYTIKKDENGKPYVLGHDDMKISISHEGDMVVAICIKF